MSKKRGNDLVSMPALTLLKTCNNDICTNYCCYNKIVRHQSKKDCESAKNPLSITPKNTSGKSDLISTLNGMSDNIHKTDRAIATKSDEPAPN